MWTLIIFLVLLIPLVAVVLDSRLGQALARRVEGGAPDNARLRALEAEVDRLSNELERVQEQAEFVTRLLEERAGKGSLEAGSGDQEKRPGVSDGRDD